MSNSLQPYGLQHTRLLCPSLSLEWVSEVAQSCLTLCDPVDCSLPGSSLHGILQARILEWVAISFSRGFSQPRDRTWVSDIAGRSFILWATREALSLSLEFAQTHVHWVVDAIQSSHLLLPRCLLPSIFSSIRVFSNESAVLISWPNYWSFSFRISRSSEYSGLISFKIDWFDPLAVQGILKSFLQHHNLKTSVLQGSIFFMVQLSQPYMTTGKTIPLIIQTYVGKVMSLLFNMLSRFVMAFLPRSKSLLIPWLQLPSAVILESKKIKSVTVSIFSSSVCHEVMGPDAMILVFRMLSFKPAFPLSSFTLIKKFFRSSLLSATRVVSSAYAKLLYIESSSHIIKLKHHIFIPKNIFSFKN